MAHFVVRCAYDANCALGDSPREKLDSLYVKLVEIMNVLRRRGAKGPITIRTGDDLYLALEGQLPKDWTVENEQNMLSGRIEFSSTVGAALLSIANVGTIVGG